MALLLPAVASVAEAVGVPVPAAAAAHPERCPKTTAVEPPWMDSGPIAPPSEPEAPSSLEQRVTFWTRVWGELPDNYHLIVDDRRPWIVFAEVDCRDLFGGIVVVPGNGAPDEKVTAAKNSCGGRITQARRDAQAKL